jgi:hypothetical protein
VGDQYAVATRVSKDGVADEAFDLMRWFSVPENLHTVQGEINTAIPNVKNVEVDPRFKDSFDKLTSQIGESQMFAYEEDKMDDEASAAIGQAWRAYQLDQMSIEDAISEIEVAFNDYADRYIEKTGLVCG